MISWNQWQLLLEIFRNGTYAGAAASLSIDATTVGRRLKLLERDLGYDLFSRDADRLFPTERCELLLSHIEIAAQALRDVEQDSAPSALGAVWRELRMTAPPFLVTNLFAPAIAELTQAQPVRVELIGTARNISLPRREADVAIRIDDRSKNIKVDPKRIDAERIGTLSYAVYSSPAKDPSRLPWAVLIERYLRGTGDEVMTKLAGSEVVQYQAYHFETLREFAAAGAARTMLPRFMGSNDPRLIKLYDTDLEQPLWMLSHRQDRDIRHLKAARSWIRDLAGSLS